LFLKKTGKDNLNKGRRFEATAVRYLKKSGYKILEQNYRTRLGEIDIICRKKDELVFVEVKGGQKNSMPFLRVDEKKLSKLKKAIDHYIHFKKPRFGFARLDVLSITEPDMTIEHFEDVL